VLITVFYTFLLWPYFVSVTAIVILLVPTDRDTDRQSCRLVGLYATLARNMSRCQNDDRHKTVISSSSSCNCKHASFLGRRVVLIVGGRLRGIIHAEPKRKEDTIFLSISLRNTDRFLLRVSITSYA